LRREFTPWRIPARSNGPVFIPLSRKDHEKEISMRLLLLHCFSVASAATAAAKADTTLQQTVRCREDAQKRD